MRAARCEPTEHTPVWLMRQAGRYMAEYRALRKRNSFLQLCKNPDLCAQIMLMPIELLKVDAGILFSDLLLILEPMGIEISYPDDGRGPLLGNRLQTAGDVDRLRELESIAPLEYVIEAVRKSRQVLSERLPLIGFAGAPFTLAAYAVEGGASRDYRHTKTLMYTDVGAWNALLGRLARAISLFLNAQIAAGAQLVQLFDSWAGCLAVDDYRRYVMPHTREVIESLPAETPVIHFATGNAALLPELKAAGGKKKNLVIGLDWRVRLDEARQLLGAGTAVQGNLDPTVLLSTPAVIRRRTKEMLEQANNLPGHIFNLGHGVLPQTPVENVIALVEAVHEFNV
ncbi:MAG: uroporphyrinogen decarboxylase [Thermoguttaceae bacterium]